MATVILRPSSIGGSTTGWNSTTLSDINDNNDATSWTQNNITCFYHGALDDLDSSLSGATINNFTITLLAAAGRAGASTVEMSLVHSSDGAFAAENESFTGSKSTQTTSARTTQQDGSSALTFAYINNCSVKIEPNNQGTTVKEVYVTVTYPDTGYGNNVNSVAAANIGEVNDVATADIEKIISV